MERAASSEASEVSTDSCKAEDMIVSQQDMKHIAETQNNPPERPKIVPNIVPKKAINKSKLSENKKGKRATPALKVLTNSSKFLGCHSQLNTPATDITPFHSPADPSKLNSEGPNWHLFNKKVADSLDKLTQLTIQDDRGSSLAKECFNADGHMT